MNTIEDNTSEKINIHYVIEQMKGIISKLESGDVTVEDISTYYEIGHEVWDATFTLKFKKGVV